MNAKNYTPREVHRVHDDRASRRRLPRHARGSALIYTAITLGALLGLVGLATDTGLVLLTANQLQNTADAAALAGAQLVRSDQDAARALARQIAEQNSAGDAPVLLKLNEDNAAEGDIVIGKFDRKEGTFTVTTASPNAVRVHARRTTDSDSGALPLVFAPMVAIHEAQVSRDAIAMIGGGTGAGLITLNEDPDKDPSLLVQGDAHLNVSGGAIQVNSPGPSAARTNGNPIVEAPELNVVGTAPKFAADGVEVKEGQPKVEDPLAWLPDPPYDPAAGQGAITGGGTYGPAVPGGIVYYDQGIKLTNGTLNLDPGIYVIGGDGVQVTGGDIYAYNVMFFILKDAEFRLAGNGNYTITPPETGDWAGVSVFAARDNTESHLINGTGELNLEGAYYFPNAHVELSGTADFSLNQLIAGTVAVSGTGAKIIAYDGRFDGVGNKVFLVE